MATAAAQNFNVRGLTSGAATIATQAIDRWEDGTWRFTVNSVPYVYDGHDPAVNMLLFTIFTGASGLPSGLKLLGNG